MADNKLDDFDSLIENVFRIYIELKRAGLNIPCQRNEYEKISKNFFLSNCFLLKNKYNKIKSTVSVPTLEELNFCNELENLRLYHYTSVSALKNMLLTNSLRLSQLKGMNDKSEGRFLVDYISNVYQKKNTKQLETLIGAITDLQKNNFSLSFSTMADDAAQWERYGNNGTGICLVTTYKKFASLVGNFTDSFGLFPIVYKSKRDIEVQDTVLDTLLSSALFKSTGELNNYYKTLAKVCPVVKDDSFANECEIRFVTDLISAKRINAKLNNKSFDPVSTVNECSDFKTYLYWYVSKYLKYHEIPNKHPWLYDAFDEIIVGPRSCKDAKTNFEKFLESEGLKNIKVSKSQSSLI